jgi:hypothetical protein
MIPLGVLAQGKYVPKTNEECYGTWTNEKGSLQKVVIFAGGWMNYTLISDTTPTYNEGTEQIETKWIDSESNIWYKFFGTITEGMGEGQKFQTLARISKSGTVYERVTAIVDEFNPKNYPTEVGPSGPNYVFFTRSGN